MYRAFPEKDDGSAAIEAKVRDLMPLIMQVCKDVGMHDYEVDEVVQEIRILVWQEEEKTRAYYGARARSRALNIVRGRERGRQGTDLEIPTDPDDLVAASDSLEEVLSSTERPDFEDQALARADKRNWARRYALPLEHPQAPRRKFYLTPNSRGGFTFGFIREV